jgi:diacylglycerol kinase (ATP)
VKQLLLIYNPASGKGRHRGAAQMAAVVQTFREAGAEVETLATTHAGSAIQQTREAAGGGFDAIISCGGDGTANEVLNGLMLAGSEVPLGVVPLGSGNLLASDLRLPSRPELAARALLNYQPQSIHPGVITSQGKSGPERRYFLVTAGVGSDAELMYRTAVEAKERWGRNAYFIEMMRMAIRRGLRMFQVTWEDERGRQVCEDVSLAMAIRASRFPGLLRLVNLGSSLRQDDYQLLLFETDKVRHFMHYFASVASGRNWPVPGVAVVKSKWFRCSAKDDERIYSQADGELLGAVPAEVSIARESFRLLMPPRTS